MRMSAREEQLRMKLAEEREKRSEENAEAAKIAHRKREREAMEAIKAFISRTQEALQRRTRK